MRPNFSSGSNQSRILWIVLASGMVAGAITARSHATPPAESLSSAKAASVIPATPEHSALQTPDLQATAPTVPADSEDALVLRQDSRMPAPVEGIGEAVPGGIGAAVPGTTVSWPAILFLGLIVGVGAFLMMSRSRMGSGGETGRNLEVLDTLRLGGRWQVSLVSAPGRLLVLGASSQEVTLLAELPLENGDYEPTSIQPTSVQPQPIEQIDEIEDDPFLKDLLTRMGSTPSTVVRTSAPSDERALLRQRIQSMQRGPTQL